MDTPTERLEQGRTRRQEGDQHMVTALINHLNGTSAAALLRKAICSKESLEIWGDGEQTRSFCYIDDCVEGVLRLMRSDYDKPLNIGSEELVSMNQLARLAPLWRRGSSGRCRTDPGCGRGPSGSGLAHDRPRCRDAVRDRSGLL